MATAAAPTVEPANASAEQNINNLEQGFGGSGPAGGASEVAATKHDSLRTRIWKHLDGEVNPEAVRKRWRNASENQKILVTMF